MADVLCPRCAAKGGVVVKKSKTDKGKELKYYECSKCHSIWTNNVDIANQPVEA